MFPWGDAQTTFGHAVGDIVYSDGSPEPGRVVSVDAETATMGMNFEWVVNDVRWPTVRRLFKLHRFSKRKPGPWPTRS